MKTLHRESLIIRGRSTLKAWEKGVLQSFMEEYKVPLMVARLKAEEMGFLHYTDVVENLIVDTGLQLIADKIIDASVNGITYHSIGLSGVTPLATDIRLGSEVARTQLPTKTRSGQTISTSAFYLADDSSYLILECGIWGGEASASLNTGTLFSHYLQIYNNRDGNVDLTFDYEAEMTRG